MSANVPQMQTFTTKPATDDTTIAEEQSINATIDVTMDETIAKDDTIEEPINNSSTPLKARDWDNGDDATEDMAADEENQDQEAEGNETEEQKEIETNSAQDADEEEEDEEEEAQGEGEEAAEEEDADEEEDAATGTSVLPLSRIKKIFKTDPDHVTASEAAVFTTAIATELFIQYLTEQASLIARSEKRKKLQYKDFSSAVSSIDQLYFLVDTVPKTHNLEGLVKTNKVKYSKETPLEKGQHTLQFGRRKSKHDEEELPVSDIEDLGDINDADGAEDLDTNDEAGDVTDNEDAERTTTVRTDADHDIIMD